MPRAVAQRVAELLDQVGIADKADAYPAQLSGGQRQRVGIARALALHPQVLLSDEATSGLDPDATESILALLTTLRDQLGLSIILITHEMDVVRKVADRVAVLRAGTIVESGSVRDLISDPQSTIGPQLLPIKPSLADDPYALALNVTYAAHTPVPPDWISLAGEHLDARIGLLGGIVEDVAARAAGRLRITIAPRSGRRLETEAVERYLTRLGLIVTRPARTERSEDLTTGAA